MSRLVQHARAHVGCVVGNPCSVVCEQLPDPTYGIVLHMYHTIESFVLAQLSHLFAVCATGEARRAEALAVILAKQQEAAANVREAAERRRAAEAERLAQLEHRQKRKQEVQVCASWFVVAGWAC